jgi:hypothetical protein
VKRLEAMLARVTYKPGWRLEIRPSPAQGVQKALYVVAEIANSWRPEEDGYFGRSAPIPPSLDKAAFYRFVFEEVLEMERHEAREWFRVDGVPPFDPHREEPGC